MRASAHSRRQRSDRSRTPADPCGPYGERPARVARPDRGDLWGTIAIQDHGADPFIYEDRRKVPLGANMAARRELFRAGRRVQRGPRSHRRQAGARTGGAGTASAGASGGASRHVCAGDGGAPPHSGQAADPVVFSKLVVREGCLARGAGADAAGDGARASTFGPRLTCSGYRGTCTDSSSGTRQGMVLKRVAGHRRTRSAIR